MKSQSLLDPSVSYGSIDDRSILSFIDWIRAGISFNKFFQFATSSPFSLNEWSGFLHISERTMQRYQKEKKKFDPIQSEKILEIALLYKRGVEVFGSNAQFDVWLQTENIALGKQTPKSFFDSSFGISLLKDELGRIESGVLA